MQSYIPYILNPITFEDEESAKQFCESVECTTQLPLARDMEGQGLAFEPGCGIGVVSATPAGNKATLILKGDGKHTYTVMEFEDSIIGVVSYDKPNA